MILVLGGVEQDPATMGVRTMQGLPKVCLFRVARWLCRGQFHLFARQLDIWAKIDFTIDFFAYLMWLNLTLNKFNQIGVN